MIYKGTTFSRNGSIKSSFRPNLSIFCLKLSYGITKRNDLCKNDYLCTGKSELANMTTNRHLDNLVTLDHQPSAKVLSLPYSQVGQGNVSSKLLFVGGKDNSKRTCWAYTDHKVIYLEDRKRHHPPPCWCTLSYHCHWLLIKDFEIFLHLTFSLSLYCILPSAVFCVFTSSHFAESCILWSGWPLGWCP